jgi:hypothetical protein
VLVIEYGPADVRFVQMWAEAVIRQLERVRAIQQKWAAGIRAAERMDGEWGRQRTLSSTISGCARPKNIP